MNPLDTKDIIMIVIFAVGGVLAVFLLTLLKKHSGGTKRLHRRYLIQLLQLIVILYCILRIVGVLNPNINAHSILLTGSALIVAIIGFAAQTAISDVICGLLISFNKPFEIGDRIIIDGLEPGIVEDITLRHIVVGIYDGLKIIVPNSQLNTKTVINTSYQNSERRGIHLTYSVSYDTDVVKAMDIIRDCVAESPYTLGVMRNGVMEDSGPVYFLKFADSALVLETTIWVTKETSSYVAATDVNLRVNNAFKDNNIEIPYNYLNVIEMEASRDEQKTEIGNNKKTSPVKRYYRTNNIRLHGDEKDISEAKNLAKYFAQRQRLAPKDARQIELLAEEAVLLIVNLVGDVKTSFWIEGSGLTYRLHLSFATTVGSEEYKRLIGLSSSGRNEALSGLGGRIFDAMMRGVTSVDKEESSQEYEWELDKKEVSQDELSESILGALSSDIKVSVTREKVEFVVAKSN
jgi:small-conductance mechanosensitive channel